MIFNLIHRPIAGEKRQIFQLQQNMAHALDLKVTLMVQYELMFDKDLMDETMRYHNEHGDEIGVWFSDIASDKMNEVLQCKEPFLWLYCKQDKKTIIKTVLEKFHSTFGFWPKSVGAYHMDAYSMQCLKEICPSIKISIAGCFEEGVKVFHGCNNSWYLFNEGMPWNPWYPAAYNTLCPAPTAKEWAGIVAVPHLSRDLALSYEGRNDFFASHPANVQRAMANDGESIPYVYNLLDLYRLQERYNNGFSYCNMFVGPGWLKGNPNVQDSDEVTQRIYYDFLRYIKELKDKNELQDMHMGEFADWYKDNIPLDHTDVYWAKEMLYGSQKHYFWLTNKSMRITLDACQGGSIGDLRPFTGKQERCSGADMPAKEVASNPYVIHSQYRAGNSFHYADGARTTLLLSYKGQTLDLCDFTVKIEQIETDKNDCVRVVFTPAELHFDTGLVAQVVSTYQFYDDGEILIERDIRCNMDTCGMLGFTEYVKACYGTTEYPVDLTGTVLSVRGETNCDLFYEYKSRNITCKKPKQTAAVLRQLDIKLALKAVEGDFTAATAEEGYLFNPFYTLSLSGNVCSGKKVATCLSMKKNK